MKMSKGGKSEKVVVIQTCIDLSWSEMKWLVNALPVNAGDEIIFLGLLHLTNPSTSSFFSVLGLKNKDNTLKTIGSVTRLLEEERTKRLEEYKHNSGIVKLQDKLQSEKKVKVSVEVDICNSRKVAAVRAAKKWRATSLILNREMKKEKQYFMDRLSCGIWSMKSNNTIIEIRVPIKENVCSYDEMIPSYSGDDDISPLKSPGTQGKTSSLLSYASTSSTSRSLMDDDSQFFGASTTSSSSTSLHSKNLNPTKKDYNMSSSGRVVMHETKKHDEKESSRSSGSRRSAAEAATSRNLNQLLKLEGSNGVIQRHANNNNKNENNKLKEFDNPICTVCKNRRPEISSHREFSYAELEEATNGFSRRNYISEGGFGLVYKGKLKGGMRIAVKQLKASSLQGEKEFKSEVYVLSQARHQNVVMLLGSCTQGSHRLLVYEYICNGSLEHNLSDKRSNTLNWEQRMKIARGAAKGLAYLHSRNIVHRDMRPGNILMTHDYETLLCDFGLAKEQEEDEEEEEDTRGENSACGVVGTLGYVAPEYAESGKMSYKTDVYSFGVVLLQLITGLRTTDEIPGGKSLVGWAKPLLEAKNYPDLIDRRILECHDVHQLFWMVLAAESCLKKDPHHRLTMEQVVHYLNCNKEGNTNFMSV